MHFYLTYKILNIKIYIKTFFLHLLLHVSVRADHHQVQYRLPDDGLHGSKHVGVTVKNCFNVNFNILYVK